MQSDQRPRNSAHRLLNDRVIANNRVWCQESAPCSSFVCTLCTRISTACLQTGQVGPGSAATTVAQGQSRMKEDCSSRRTSSNSVLSSRRHHWEPIPPRSARKEAERPRCTPPSPFFSSMNFVKACSQAWARWSKSVWTALLGPMRRSPPTGWIVSTLPIDQIPERGFTLVLWRGRSKAEKPSKLMRRPAPRSRKGIRGPKISSAVKFLR